MEYEIVPGPFLLMETVAMLYKYVNGISFQSAISRQRFFMSNTAYQAQSKKMARLSRSWRSFAPDWILLIPGCSIISPAPTGRRRACALPS